MERRGECIGRWVVLALILVGGLWAPAMGDDVVNIPDAALEAEVRLRLGLEVGQPITREAMEGLTGLSVHFDYVTDLTGLEYATHLTTLAVGGSGVVDLSPIEGLTEIWNLGIGSDSLATPPSLAAMPRLTWFALSSPGITEFPDMSGPERLQILNLSNCRIRNIPSVTDLPDLIDLRIAGNGLSDATGLASMPDLGYVDLSDNQLTFLPNLMGLQQLHLLSLADNQIEDVSEFSSLLRGKFLQLDLRNNRISDIVGLTGLTGMRELDLRGNPLAQAAYDEHIPAILANNPDIDLKYDPVPEPATGVLLVGALPAMLIRYRGYAAVRG